MAEEAKKGKTGKSEKGNKAGSAAEKADSKKPAKKSRSRKRTVVQGKAYVQASYNNTIITLTDPEGNVLSWSSSGSSGFKGARKATPYAAQISAENAAEKAKVYGLEKIHVFITGVGSGREQSIRGLIAKGLDLLSISDLTPMPHNGCRKKKARRI
ncbi:MAG: 30S ribosomal protein S11 [Patescibacteria group bacterium]